MSKLMQFNGREWVEIKGSPGIDGKTPTTQELMDIIVPLIPEPTPGKDGSPDTSEDIRNKLELITEEEEKLKIEAIAYLRKELDELRQLIGKKSIVYGGGGGATGGKIMKYYDLSDQLNGVTKTFSLPAFWRVINVQCSSSPNPMRPDVDYTVDGSNMQITFTSQVDETTTLAAPQTLLVLYAEA